MTEAATGDAPAVAEPDHGGGGPGHRVDGLDRLFFPRRVAIAGLSTRPQAWGRMAYQYLCQAGYGGEVVAYRPRHDDPDVPTVTDLADGSPTDVVVVAVPAPAAVEVVAEAAVAGVGAAVVFSAGFAEAGDEGLARQRRLTEAAGGMPVLGPNCLGVVSAPGSLVLSVSAFLGRPRSPGPVALVSQSGAIGFVLADQLRRRGVGFSYYASTGNEAVLGAADLVSYLCERPEVRVVGCYLEGLRDVGAWRDACRRARLAGRHVVALKVGTTRAAQRAARSHTASAAGDAELFEAACREDGVTVVRDEQAFAEAVTALCRPVELPARPRLAIVTMSGGGGAMLADQLAPVADVPPLAEATRATLRDLDIGLAGDANPVDLTGMFFAQLGRLDDVLAAVTGDDDVDGAVLYLTFGDRLAGAYRSLARSLPDRTAPTWFVWAGAPEGEVEALAATGRVVPAIPDLVRSVASQPRRLPFAEGLVEGARAAEGAKGAEGAGEAGPLPAGTVVCESDLAPWLARRGMGTVDLAVADDRDGLLEAVDRLGLSPPWVVKVEHPDAPHRARLGLVTTGVRAREQLGAEAGRLLAAAASHGLAGSRVVVEPMLTSVASFSLGALRHPGYGPLLLVGPGGDRAEETGVRRAAALLPLSDRGLAALAERVGALCGRSVAPESLVAPLLAVERLLDADRTVTEVDVNPVLVTSGGELVAVDALAVRSAPAEVGSDP
jgi:acyl-CoA synthetase (NDP forming)